MKLIIILFAIHLCYDLVSGLECTGPHEHLWENTPLCPLQCDNLHKMICMALTNKPSCQCRDGTVRDTKKNKCVYLNECPGYYKSKPNECNAENELAADVVSACPKTCSHPVGPLCAAVIHKPSCVCAEGTVRDTVNNKCVRLEDCPKKDNQTIEYTQTKGEDIPKLVCNGQNEKYSDWISACPDVCPHTGIQMITPPPPSKCLAIIEKPSCICINGTIRDTIQNRCVTRGECIPVPFSQLIDDQMKCNGENEFLSRLTTCQPSCQTPWIPKCDLIPSDEPLCVCIPGTIRDSISGKCVHLKDCPKKIIN